MKVKLTTGEEAWIRISHRGVRKDGRRVTSVLVSLPEPTNPDAFVTYVGRASCSHGDNFCKRTGRKLALTRLLQTKPFDKANRRILWQTVCPEYYKTAK